MNRFKGLELVNSVPGELWIEVCNVVQKTENEAIPKKNKSKRANWLCEEDLQIVKERKEMKSNGEKERYIQLDADFPRTALRDKKPIFNGQCIKLEENNRRGKTRDFFRKIGDIKGTFCPKMGTIKIRNGKDVVDTEEIKNRWEECTGQGRSM